MDRQPVYASRKAEFVNLLKAYYIDQFDFQNPGGHVEVATTTTQPETPVTGAAAVATAVASGAMTGAGGSAITPNTTEATTTGTTTGGSSSSSLGPTNTSQGTLEGRLVYGPEWKGVGEGGVEGGDSTKSRSYPTLLGPKPVPSTRIDGVGIVAPSQNYLLGLSGSLPSMGSLGATEMSRYFPYSRTANTEIGVDPWRVASAFSTSSYSQKTDPVPFLADFSAFQR